MATDRKRYIVVPFEHAEAVAQIAREIANDDKRGRLAKYEEAGIPPDETVRPLE